MANLPTGTTRRAFLQLLTALGACAYLGPEAAASDRKAPITKPIPSTDEQLPVIGMGSWITFDVWGQPRAVEERVQVLQAFFDKGGALIDSSPMYDSSEKVIGYCLNQIPNEQALFAATKVWTLGRWFGIRQMNSSRELWGVDRFDLIQIHNMLDWKTHFKTLQQWKQEGKVRYVGITTSHGRRHDDLMEAMKKHPFDFVQFTYNILDREAEKQLLPLARDRGMAVIANRPFRGGALFDMVKGKRVPGWAHEFGCDDWPQFFLKFIASHSAITCAIPATSNPAHMVENMGAGFGRLPDEQARRRMVRHIEQLR